MQVNSGFCSLLLEALPPMIIGINELGTVLYWNHHAQELLNLPTEQAVGKSLDELPVQWDKAFLRQQLDQASAIVHGHTSFEIQVTRKGLPHLLLSFTISPLGGQSTHPGFLLLGEDVTQRQQLEMQLQQARKLQSIGQLAAGIAHEINTPIQYVGDNVRFLGDACNSLLDLMPLLAQLLEALPDGHWRPHTGAIRDILERIDVPYLSVEVPLALRQTLEGVERVTKIVRAMKDFSHPGAEEKIAVNLNRAVSSTVTVCRNEWRYVADLEMDLEPDLPWVTCLPGPINEVILNLIVNAADAIADARQQYGWGDDHKGLIRVATHHTDNEVQLTVSDTGTGMSEAISSRIFDPFFTTKEVGCGTGQGLAITHQIVVERHGGRIEVDTQLGRGSSFKISLPITAVI